MCDQYIQAAGGTCAGSGALKYLKVNCEASCGLCTSYNDDGKCKHWFHHS